MPTPRPSQGIASQENPAADETEETLVPTPSLWRVGTMVKIWPFYRKGWMFYNFHPVLLRWLTSHCLNMRGGGGFSPPAATRCFQLQVSVTRSTHRNQRRVLRRDDYLGPSAPRKTVVEDWAIKSGKSLSLWRAFIGPLFSFGIFTFR